MQIRSLAPFGLLLSLLFTTQVACSRLSLQADSSQVIIPEIQGVWRYSEGLAPDWKQLTTFEFSENAFLMQAMPNRLARGSYIVKSQKDGSFILTLQVDESQNVELDKIQVRATGGKALWIDGVLYRRVLRQ